MSNPDPLNDETDQEKEEKANTTNTANTASEYDLLADHNNISDEKFQTQINSDANGKAPRFCDDDEQYKLCGTQKWMCFQESNGGPACFPNPSDDFYKELQSLPQYKNVCRGNLSDDPSKTKVCKNPMYNR